MVNQKAKKLIFMPKKKLFLLIAFTFTMSLVNTMSLVGKWLPFINKTICNNYLLHHQ